MDACLTAKLIDYVANGAPIYRIKIQVFLLEFMNSFCEPNKSLLNGLKIHIGSCIKYFSVLIYDKVDTNLLYLIFEFKS